MFDIDHGVQSPALQCQWLEWRATSPSRLELHLPSMNYPDMTGCVDVAEMLNPQVLQISVWVGRARDMVYARRRVGAEWIARKV